MTRIRVATWNVHEAIRMDGVAPDDPSSFWIDLADAKVDVAALQEVCFAASGEPDDLAKAAQFAGMPNFKAFPLSASCVREDQMAGLAILSRYPLRDDKMLLLPNPELRYEHEGVKVNSYDKGLLTAVLDAPNGPIRVTSLHLPPFHRFGRAPQEFGEIWDALASSVDALDDLPLLVCGDFNTSDRELLTGRVARPLYRAIDDEQDTHRGRAADDILYTDPFDLAMSEVIGTPSDHGLCLADVVLRSGTTDHAGIDFAGADTHDRQCPPGRPIPGIEAERGQGRAAATPGRHRRAL